MDTTLQFLEFQDIYSVATTMATVGSSKLLNSRGGRPVIIPAGRMLESGPALHHLVVYRLDPRRR